MKRSLSELLAFLPPMGKDGYYFELRKMTELVPPGDPSVRFVEWKCAKTNNVKDDCSSIGTSPEQAVEKMLTRLGIDFRDPHAVCVEACETAYIRLLQLPHESFRLDSRTQQALCELRDALALAKNLQAKSAVDEYTDLALSDMRKRGDQV